MFTVAMIGFAARLLVNLGTFNPPAPYTRWAIVPSAELESSGVAGHVSESLARDGVAKILDPADVRAALNASDSKPPASAPSVNSKTAKMIKADAVLTLDVTRRGQRELIRIVAI